MKMVGNTLLHYVMLAVQCMLQVQVIALTEKNALSGTTLAKDTTSSADQVEIKMIRSFVGTADSNDKSFTFECTLPATAKES